MKPNVFLEGKNIYLRGLEEADAQGNYKYWFNDKDVCGGNSHHRFPMAEESLKRYINGANNSSDRIILAIVDKLTDSHIGNISLQNINYINRSAEFAIIIGEKDYWDKSIGRDAATLIIEHGFNSLNLNRIYCGTYSNNLGMQNMALALGFVKEGILREADFKEGNYVDIIKYGLLRKEYKK